MKKKKWVAATDGDVVRVEAKASPQIPQITSDDLPISLPDEEEPKIQPGINPLICIPSPRYIEVFNEHISLLPYDKIWVKYYPEPRAYQIFRDYFLEHKEYTHLVIIPDDLLVKPEHFERLKKDVEEYKFSIVGGICNLSCLKADRDLTVLLSDDKICPHPDVPIPFKEFDWARFSELESKYKGHDIIKVSFTGFPCLFIDRKIVEDVPFRANQRGWSIDLTFCYDCQSKKIPIYADKRVQMLHLKGIDPYKYRHIQVDTLLVNREKATVFLESGKTAPIIA